MKPGHVVLVGLPGAGKSTAGRRAAAEMALGFLVLDEQIATESGLSIPELIARDGESQFRVRERDTMLRTLGGPPTVIAPGGGWAAQPGNLEAVEGIGIVVYLEVTPAVAARRLGDASGRPLLADGPVLERLTELQGRREKYYRRAAHTIATDDKSAAQVAVAIAALARKHAGL